MSNENKKNSNIITFLSVLAAIAAILSLGLSIYDPFKNKKATIEVNELDYYSSQNVNIDKPVLVKQTQTVIPSEEKEYVLDWYTDYNVQEVLVTNNNKFKDISLTNFKFVAENIEVDYSPVLYANSISKEENSVSLLLYNKGWGDATNLNLMLKSNDGSIDFSKYDQTIETLTYSEYKEVDFQLDLEDFEYLLNGDDTIYSINLEISYDESEDNYEYPTGYSLIVENGKVQLYLGGNGGGGGNTIYGIMIDTSEPKFEFSQDIQESIEAGRILDVPVFFYPNKSCEFDYYFEFTVHSGKNEYLIKSEKQHTKYRISSTEDLKKYDATNEEDIAKNEQYIKIISYPYINNK